MTIFTKHSSTGAAWAAWTGLCALAAAALLGCGDSSCDSAGRTFPDGAQWTCADGCNACACDDGTQSSTAIGCPQPPGPAANKLSCKDDGSWHQHASSWSCEHGCGRCVCEDGRIRSDRVVCSGGAAGES